MAARIEAIWGQAPPALATMSRQVLDLAAGTSSEVLPGTPDGATYTTSGIFLQDVIDIGVTAVISDLRTLPLVIPGGGDTPVTILTLPAGTIPGSV